MIIIRPEQFLVYSDVSGVKYEVGHRRKVPAPELHIPKAIDDYREVKSEPEDKSGQDAGQPDAKGMVGDGSARKGPELRSWLLTLVEFDGDLRTYFRDIGQFLASDFDSIFQNCSDFTGTRNFEEFWTWIRRYQIDTALFYPRYRDLSVARIKQLQDFKRRFDEFVATVRSPTGPRVKSMDELFDEFLRKTQQYARDFPTPAGTFKPGAD